MDVEAIDRALRDQGSSERSAREKAYLKSPLRHYGVAVPVVRRIAGDVVRSGPAMSRERLWSLVDGLWPVPVHERRLCAIVLLGRCSRLLVADDMARLEALLRGCPTWALVDTLATSAVSDLVGHDPAAAPTLDRWVADDDHWIRRAALLALVPALRRGGGDWDRFAGYADRLLDEREFFIRKAIGWGLRDAGRKRPDLVFEWVRPRVARLSGVTLREALKPLTEAQRSELLALR